MLAQIVLFDGFDALSVTIDGEAMTGLAKAGRLPASRVAEHREAPEPSGAGA